MLRPDLSEERKLWKKGYNFVIGVDEVGRGAFAGPVVVGTVVFPRGFKINHSSKDALKEVHDSKLLSPKKRNLLTKDIKRKSLAWAVTKVEVPTINKIGIGKATQVAFRKAVAKLFHEFQKCHSGGRRPIESQRVHPEGDAIATLQHDRWIELNNNETTQQSNYYVLVDGFHIRYLKGIGLRNQKAIIKGDRKSISIAAASIIAKVHRDELMQNLHQKHPAYGFYQNKGYGTKQHREAINKYGLCKSHRLSFNLSKFT